MLSAGVTSILATRATELPSIGGSVRLETHDGGTIRVDEQVVNAPKPSRQDQDLLVNSIG